MSIQEMELILNSYSKGTSSNIRKFLQSNNCFTPCDIENIHQKLIKILIEKENQTLFALYAGIFNANYEEFVCTDQEILNIILFYFNLKLFCSCPAKEIFSLTSEQKKSLLEIYEILENWYFSLTKLYELKNKKKSKEFDLYVRDLYNMTQNLSENSWIILPNGFEKVEYTSNSTSSTLELIYDYDHPEKAMNHSSSIIIKKKGKSHEVELSLVDPLSPYVPKLQDEISEKIMISLNFQANQEDLTKSFIEMISKMKIYKPRNTKHYFFSNFYESLLPSIKGNLAPIKYEKNFITNYDLGINKSSILCIKIH